MKSLENTDFIGYHLSSDEPVLFEMNVPMDKKHITDFNYFCYRKRNRKTFILNAVIGIISIILGTAAGSSISVLLGVLVIAYPYISLGLASAKSMENAYSAGNGDNYRFYSDRLADRSNFSLEVVPYSFILDAYETEDYFFIFISSNKAFIIPKNCFVWGDPTGFRIMLSEKLWNRFQVLMRKGR